MKLKLIEVDEYRGGWDVPDGYQFQDHWQGSRYYGGGWKYREFKVLNDEGTEVARVELDAGATREGFRCSTYPIPEDGPELLEIQFLDVRADFRGQGVGTWIVRYLERENPGVQLVALSEASEGFWVKVGWERILPDDRMRREMYVAPLDR